jgi:hypothetical protein
MPPWSRTALLRANRTRRHSILPSSNGAPSVNGGSLVIVLTSPRSTNLAILLAVVVPFRLLLLHPLPLRHLKLQHPLLTSQHQLPIPKTPTSQHRHRFHVPTSPEAFERSAECSFNPFTERLLATCIPQQSLNPSTTQISSINPWNATSLAPVPLVNTRGLLIYFVSIYSLLHPWAPCFARLYTATCVPVSISYSVASSFYRSQCFTSSLFLQAFCSDERFPLFHYRSIPCHNDVITFL